MTESCATCRFWTPVTGECELSGLVVLGTSRCHGYRELAPESKMEMVKEKLKVVFWGDWLVPAFVVWTVFMAMRYL